MEALAGRPGTHIAWSSEVGSLERAGVRAVFAAMVLEDNAQPVRKVRGVRIDLSTGNDHDQIYLGEEAMARTRSALVEIANAAAQNPPGRNGCMGAREFWPLYSWPWNKYHELNVDFCGESKNSSLVLYPRGKNLPFRLPGENPAHLAAIFGAAMDQLKQH
jgi:hypothetical protein